MQHPPDDAGGFDPRQAMAPPRAFADTAGKGAVAQNFTLAPSWTTRPVVEPAYPAPKPGLSP